MVIEEQNDKASGRRVRMEQLNEKCNRILHYLRHGKYVAGLTNNLQRSVRAQAKNYVWDETSKLLISLHKQIVKVSHIPTGI